jgi:predicted MFS family arabinose efflux permease
MTLAAFQFISMADFMVLSPLGPVLMRTFNVGPLEMGLLMSVYSLSAAAAGLFGTLFIDRYDRRSVLLICFAAFLFAVLLCAVAPSYLTLIIARIIAGAFGGLMSAMIQTIVADVVPFERRGRASGLISSSFSLATILGIPLSLFLASHWGWHAPFVFIAGLGAIFILVARKTVPSLILHVQPKSKTKVSLFRPLKLTLSEPNHRRAFLFVILMNVSTFLVIPFVSIYYTLNVGITEKQLPIVYLIGGLATLISVRWVGKMADRFGKHRFYVWWATLGLFPILLTTHLPSVSLGWLLLASTFFFVVVPSRMIPAMAIIGAAAKPELRGTFMSLSSAVQSIASGLAAFVSGLIVTRAPSGQLQHFELAGYLAVAISVLAIFYVRRVRVYPTNTLNTPV